MTLRGKKLDFCYHYGNHENGALAARQAGYSAKTSNVKASQLLTDPAIRAKCDQLIAERLKRLDITSEKILAELAKIAFTDTTEIIDLCADVVTVEDFEALSPEQRATIASVKKDKHGNIVLTFHDKITALTKLGQHKKLFTDVQENKNTFTAMGTVGIMGEDGEVKPLEFDIGQEPSDTVQ